jgi:uncharacterized surface protein with fasciclin (FAS1) repeats
MSVKLLRASAAVALAGALFGGARAEGKERVKAPKDIVEVVAGQKNFSTLVAAVKAAGLVETLKGEGPFTLFAPANAAFKKLGEAKLKELLADKGKLAKVLKYHVLAGAVPASKVLALEGKGAKTVAGPEVRFAARGAGKKRALVLNGTATVVAVDVKARNGVIHVIDAVLLPPE